MYSRSEKNIHNSKTEGARVKKIMKPKQKLMKQKAGKQ